MAFPQGNQFGKQFVSSKATSPQPSPPPPPAPPPVIALDPTADTSVPLLSITPEQRMLFRRRMDRDPWYFCKYVCNHTALAVERIHRPLLYGYTRQIELLCATLDNPRFEGEITEQIRAQLTKRKLDWRNPKHIPLIREAFRRTNWRLPRGTGKSTFADDADLWEVTQNPNLTVFVGSKSDDYAEKRVTAIGDVVKSPAYAFWYPERVPTSFKESITQAAIWLNGRTIAQVEGNIEGRGITSQNTGLHFRKIRPDDIVGTESGQANEDDAHNFIANIEGISVRKAFGGTDVMFVGTVTSENDDHSMLAEDPSVISIVMPVERHPGGTTLENINNDGTLTMPEPGWFPREEVDRIKAEAKSNPKRGLMWLLQNFYMTANKSGVMTFTQQQMDMAKFIWFKQPQTGVRFILRPKIGKRDTPRQTIKTRSGVERIVPLRPDDWFLLDLRKLPRSAFAWACDQAVSATGDPWSMSLACMDWEGVIYLLANIADVGYPALLDNLLPFDDKAKNEFYCPGKPLTVGLDTNATQGMTTEWLTRDPQFRDLARRVKGLSSNTESKEAQIRRWLQGRMLSGDTYYNPELRDFEAEATNWRPRKPDGSVNRKAVDNRLDASWMASSLLRRPPSPEQLDEDEMDALLDEEAQSRHTDRQTGISTEDWTQYMWR